MQTKLLNKDRLSNFICFYIFHVLFFSSMPATMHAQHQERDFFPVLSYVDIRAGSLHHYLNETNSLSNYDANIKFGLVKLEEKTFLYSSGGVYSKNFRQKFIVNYYNNDSTNLNLNISYNTIYYFGIGVNRFFDFPQNEIRLNVFCALNYAKQITLIRVKSPSSFNEKIRSKNTIQNINVGIQGIYDLGKGYGIGLDISLFREFQVSFLRSSRDNDSPSTPFLTRTPTPLLSAGINLTISKSFYRKQ